MRLSHLSARIAPAMFVALLLASCIGREFDDNDLYRHAQATEMAADNGRLLSKIFILDESKAYVWFDVNNEVANFSKPELVLPLEENSVRSTRRIPLRGLLYEYRAETGELTFKRIPARFVQMGSETLSITFFLHQTEGTGALLPGGKTLPGTKKAFKLELKHAVIDGDGQALEIGRKVYRGGRSYKLLPFTAQLTLIN